MNGNTIQGAAGRDGSADLLVQRESQLSAMFDGELPEAECELLARRLARDENLRRSWANYALIGQYVREFLAQADELAPRAVERHEPLGDLAIFDPMVNPQRFGLSATLVKKRAFVTLLSERAIHALQPIASVIGESRDRQHHPYPGKQRRPTPQGA